MELNNNPAIKRTPTEAELAQLAKQRENLQSGLTERKATEKKLKILVISGFIFLFILGFVLAIQYLSKLSEPPKSYFELQLRTHNSIVSAYPKSSTAHANLGFIYFQMKDYDNAKKQFEIALSLDKNDITGNFFLGEIYKVQSKDDLAIKYLSRAVILASKTKKYTAYYDLGEIYEAKGDYKKAMDYYQLSIADNTTTWNAHYKVGTLYERQGNTIKALEEYKKAFVFNPDSTILKKAIAKLENTKPKK